MMIENNISTSVTQIFDALGVIISGKTFRCSGLRFTTPNENINIINLYVYEDGALNYDLTQIQNNPT